MVAPVVSDSSSGWAWTKRSRGLSTPLGLPCAASRCETPGSGVRLRDHRDRPARRRGRGGHHAVVARDRTPHLPLPVRRPARRCERQPSAAPRARPDDRRRAGRVRVVAAAPASVRPEAVDDHRRAPPAAARADGRRRRAAGAYRRVRGLAGSRRRAAPAGRRAGRRGDRAADVDAAGPGDPVGLRGRRRSRRGLQRAAGRRPVHHHDPAAQLASPRGRHHVDHVQPGGGGGRPGHPSRSLPALAGLHPCRICSPDWRC